MKTVLVSIVPVGGIAVDLFLLSQLHSVTSIVGGLWLVLGVIVLAVATRGFRRPVPNLDAEMDGGSSEAPEGIKTAP